MSGIRSESLDSATCNHPATADLILRREPDDEEEEDEGDKNEDDDADEEDDDGYSESALSK